MIQLAHHNLPSQMWQNSSEGQRDFMKCSGSLGKINLSFSSNTEAHTPIQAPEIVIWHNFETEYIHSYGKMHQSRCLKNYCQLLRRHAFVSWIQRTRHTICFWCTLCGVNLRHSATLENHSQQLQALIFTFMFLLWVKTKFETSMIISVLEYLFTNFLNICVLFRLNGVQRSNVLVARKTVICGFSHDSTGI